MNGSLSATGAPQSREIVPLGLAYYWLTSCVVFAGVWLGTYVLPQQGTPQGLVERFARLDGVAYAEIAETGYWYDPARPSYVAYFPAYPLLGRAVRWLTGLSSEAALLLVSHICLAAAFVMMGAYVAARWPCEPRRTLHYALLSLGLWPTALFFRMAYTESMFLLVTLGAMYGMHRRWPNTVIALTIGLATATRPVGIALVPVFMVHLWDTASSMRRLTLRSMGLLPLACWGLIAYMLYLYAAFGDPLAFATTQRQWMHRPAAWSERLPAVLALEPLWSPYLHGSPTYWARPGAVTNPLSNYGFMNPILFVATCALIVIGFAERWLDRGESLLSALLLGVPYTMVAYDNLMLSQPRFASVVFPAYLVAGRLVSRVPFWAAGVLMPLSAALLGALAALFAGGYGYDYKILY